MRAVSYLSDEHLGPNLSIRWRGTRRVLIEQPPTRKLYGYLSGLFHLPMPWLYYTLTYTGGEQMWVGSHGRSYVRLSNILCSPVRITREDQPFFAIPLSNLYYSTRPCMMATFCDKPEDFGVKAAEQIATWWEQVANNDAFPAEDPVYKYLTRNFKARPAKRVGNRYHDHELQRRMHFFEQWEKVSDRAALKLPYRQLGRDMRSLLRLPQAKLIPA